MGEDEQKAFHDLTKGVELGGEAKEAEEAIKTREKFSEIIDHLNYEQLGRAIVSTGTDPKKIRVSQMDDGGLEVEEQPSQQRESVVGYSLPLKDDDTQHLLLFKNGVMVICESATDSGETLALYKNRFSSNESPIVGYGSGKKAIAGTVKWFVQGNLYHSKVTHVNSDPSKAVEMEGFFDQAIDLAVRKKALREEAQLGSMRSFLGKIENKLFGKQGLTTEQSGQTHPSNQPPVEPPQL